MNSRYMAECIAIKSKINITSGSEGASREDLDSRPLVDSMHSRSANVQRHITASEREFIYTGSRVRLADLAMAAYGTIILTPGSNTTRECHSYDHVAAPYTVTITLKHIAAVDIPFLQLLNSPSL
jgi:hypothetical protein